MSDMYDDYFADLSDDTSKDSKNEKKSDDLIYYDKELLSNITSGLVAASAMCCLRNVASSLNGILGMNYLGKIKKSINKLLKAGQPDWHEKDDCIDAIILVSQISNWFDENSRFKKSADYEFLIEAFQTFKDRYITWEA